MRSILTLVMVLLLATSARAQIVNTQPLLSKGESSGFSGELAGNFEWRSGNVELLRLGASSILVWRVCDHAIISSSEFEVGDASGERFLLRSFSHLRHQYRLGARVTWETFGQVAQDRFRRIQLRALVGTGPRWTLVDAASSSLVLGTAYMFEHEDYADAALLADGGTSRDSHRASVYLSTRHAIDDRLALVATVFYQPRLDAPGDDWRLLGEAQLAITLADHLALKLSLSIAYDQAPPDTIERLDTTTKVGVSWTL